MIAAVDSKGSEDAREAARTHMFVAASLFWGNVIQPVRIRNMSLSGALVEGSSLPPPGMRIQLKRGNLQTVAEVAWQGGNRAGLAFSTPVVVADWLANHPPIRKSLPGNRELDESDAEHRLHNPQQGSNTELDRRNRELDLLMEELEQAMRSFSSCEGSAFNTQGRELLLIAVARLSRLIATSQAAWR